MQLLKGNLLLMLSICLMLTSSFKAAMPIPSLVTPALTIAQQQHTQHHNSQHQDICFDGQMHCQQLMQSDCYSACTNIPYFLPVTTLMAQSLFNLAPVQVISIGSVIRRVQSILRPPLF